LARFHNAEADALALGNGSLRSLLPRFRGARLLDGKFSAPGTVVAVLKGNATALEPFGRIIKELKSNGTVLKISDTHRIVNATVAPAVS
jgi:hypothetical protein